MKSDTGDNGAAAPETTTTIDDILSRFDAAIERLQQAAPDTIDTGELDTPAAPDLEIEVHPVTDTIDLQADTDDAPPADDSDAQPTDDLDLIEQLVDDTDTVEADVETDADAPQPDDEPATDTNTDADDDTTPEVPDFVPDLPDELDDTALVSIRGLTKHFGDVTAADNVSIDIQPGSIVGIVGPNGAGKTTTLSMLTGMLRPDAGAVLINGHDIWANPDDAKKHLGIVPDRMRVFDRLTGAQLLHYSGVLRGLDRDTIQQRTTQLADTLGITDALGRLVDNYSSGMMKKLALATALIHAPTVLVLDEPFEAVDPVSVNIVVDLLRRFAANGGAVVLSSHSLGLIEDLCDEVAVIVGGRVIAAGTVDEVRGDDSLENRFIALVRDDDTAEDMEWLHTFSA